MPSLSNHPDPVLIGGVPFAPMTCRQVVDRVFAELGAGKGGWLVTANIDFLRRSSSDPEIRTLYGAADLIVADGAPVLWASHLQGTPLPERVPGSDLVPSFASRAAREGRSLYLLGGAPGSSQRAAERLRQRLPSLRLAGWSSPWISPAPTQEELALIVSEVVPTSPGILCVALGSPKQELVISALRPHLPSTWMIGCGISLSFLAGDLARAPAWMQRSGLEWLHRLAQEPSRLAGRYLLSDFPFALKLLARAVLSRASGRPPGR